MDPNTADVLKTLITAGAPLLAAYLAARFTVRRERSLRALDRRAGVYEEAVLEIHNLLRSADAAFGRPVGEPPDPEDADLSKRLQRWGARLAFHGTPPVVRAMNDLLATYTKLMRRAAELVQKGELTEAAVVPERLAVGRALTALEAAMKQELE